MENLNLQMNLDGCNVVFRLPADLLDGISKLAEFQRAYTPGTTPAGVMKQRLLDDFGQLGVFGGQSVTEMATATRVGT